MLINPYVFDVKDPFFSNVSLLLHGNGTNGSTTITDSSPSPKTVTALGNAMISTAQSRFGGSSIAFDGSGDYLSVPRTGLFVPVANESFTIEAWIYLLATPPATASQIAGLTEYGTDSDWVFFIDTSLKAVLYLNSITTSFTSGPAVSLNTWTHVAASRSGTSANNLKVFVNGVGTSFSTNATTLGSGSRNLTIGADQNGDEGNFNGYIDELRLTKGVGRYTSNFSPPTAPFPDF